MTPAAALLEAVAVDALGVASRQADPGSVAAATALRKRFAPEVAAAALSQASLRRRAVAKFGDTAAGLFFTADGLEQATRPEVAAHRARRLVAAGMREVVDLGCGIGADSIAFAEAGLAVTAVERDPPTAAVARLNLEPRGVRVIEGDAETVAADLPGEASGHRAVFCDPARRGARGRTWDVAQFTPSWEFVSALLAGPACLKLGPGVPMELIPDGVEACFVSHHGDLVEAAIWSAALTDAPGRVAELLAADGSVHRLRVGAASTVVTDRVPAPGDVILEPDPAVLRAGATDTLAQQLGAARVADRIGYLLAPREHATPFARGYRVLEVLPHKERELRAWVRERGMGVLEIKKRGLEFDPAALRRRLLGRKGFGDNAATLLVTPTVAGARVLVVAKHPQIV